MYSEANCVYFLNSVRRKKETRKRTHHLTDAQVASDLNTYTLYFCYLCI